MPVDDRSFERRSYAFALLSKAVYDWCLRNATLQERRGRIDASLEWCRIAASGLREFGRHQLCAVELEDVLARVGQATCRPRGHGVRHGARRWLHVVSQSYPIGGHTAIARRWIAQACDGSRHDVVLTRQHVDAADPGLVDAVARNGGTFGSLAGVEPLIERARALRSVADERADVVVLHTDPEDLVAPLAFAAAGGAPVLLMNHQDHGFWLGAWAADQVIDIRESGAHLTRRHRSPRAQSILPVPLVDSGFARRDRTRAATLAGATVHRAARVLLTIGGADKYDPSPRLDFPAAARAVMKARPQDILLAVGPNPGDPIWRRLHDESGGRVIALGPQRDLAPWRAAADVYVEGFPIGSYTALLETALAGIPLVRKPLLMPEHVLPVDQGALAGHTPPQNAGDWVARVIDAAEGADADASRDSDAREAVLRAHCGRAWQERLAAMVRAVPGEHAPSTLSPAEPTPAELRDYWLSTVDPNGPVNPFNRGFERAMRAGLRPTVDLDLAAALREARDHGCRVTAPAVAVTASRTLAALPARLADWVYKAF